MLAHTKLDPDFSIPTLARRADGLSGSDLRETCRNAAMAPVRELMREKGKSGKEGLEEARKEVSLIDTQPCPVGAYQPGIQSPPVENERFRVA